MNTYKDILKENQELKIKNEQHIDVIKRANEIIIELNNDIEKMKNCDNCSKSRIGKSCSYNFNNFDCKKDNHKEWELHT